MATVSIGKSITAEFQKERDEFVKLHDVRLSKLLLDKANVDHVESLKLLDIQILQTRIIEYKKSLENKEIQADDEWYQQILDELLLTYYSIEPLQMTIEKVRDPEDGGREM